jgi:hypothetical protein
MCRVADGRLCLLTRTRSRGDAVLRADYLCRDFEPPLPTFRHQPLSKLRLAHALRSSFRRVSASVTEWSSYASEFIAVQVAPLPPATAG